MTKKTISVELDFLGDGSVVEKKPGHFFGGVPDPHVGSNIQFTVHSEELDEAGLLNPVSGAPTVAGAFQINVYGTSNGYRELGRYLLALAELDAGADPDFHQHLDDLLSADLRTHLHVILRKK